MRSIQPILFSTLIVAAGASPALAAKPTMADCNKLAAQVTAAIRAHPDAADLKKARSEQSTGAYFCGLGSAAKGIDHYNQALALLGAQQQAAANPSSP